MENTPNADQNSSSNQRWAHFRFSVVGPLLASPPPKGQLRAALKELAAKNWRHPISGEWTQFGFSTIERWYYLSQGCGPNEGPVDVLKRKKRRDHGQHPSLRCAQGEFLANQYRQHPGWSYQLHYDNLAAAAAEQPSLGPLPSYITVLRFMKSHGYIKRRRRGPQGSPGAQVAEERYENRETRSYENAYVNGLWHLDFHHGSLPVLQPNGEWVYPIALGILDDHSRLCCHLQWYLNEKARELCHGLSQAFQKRALPRSILFDNGPAMIAKETLQGLARLSVMAEHTLPYSPQQNGKQESWWGQVEGRLLPMLEGAGADLTLRKLNEVSLAWVEMEYNRKVHSEIGQSPLERYLQGKDVGRPSPGSRQLQEAFTAGFTRTQRRSDGTISLEGIRFEIPSRYGHMQKLTGRYASWDLRWAHLWDADNDVILCRIYPLNKTKNAEGLRAAKSPQQALAQAQPQPQEPPGMAPLLAQILREYAATGLPPAYLPLGESPSAEGNEEQSQQDA